MYPSFARADSSEVLPVSNPCALPYGEEFREQRLRTVTLSHSYRLTADKIGWLGRDSLAAFLAISTGQVQDEGYDREDELAQKESEYNKASANERLLEKKLQKSTEIVEKLRKQLQSEQDMLGRFGPALSQAKETTEQSLDELRVMRIAVRGAGANGDKNAPRLTPMEQDTDTLKQKIRLLNESAKRARTETNVETISGWFACYAYCCAWCWRRWRQECTATCANGTRYRHV